MASRGFMLAACLVLLVGTHTNAGLFGKSASDLETLAVHLAKATESTSLEDNAKAAEGLSEQPNASAGLIKLAKALSDLKSSSESAETFCHEKNSANVRVAAEAMHASGYLEAGEKSEPVQRLNSILAKLIEEAWEVCEPHLAAKWADYKKPTFNVRYGDVRVNHLASMPIDYILLNHVGNLKNSDGMDFSVTISGYLKKCERSVPMDQKKEKTTFRDKAIIEKQLVDYIDKPCFELLSYEERLRNGSLPASYLNLWIARRMISKFHEQPRRSAEELARWARAYGACARLVEAPKRGLVEAVLNNRF